MKVVAHLTPAERAVAEALARALVKDLRAEKVDHTFTRREDLRESIGRPAAESTDDERRRA